MSAEKTDHGQRSLAEALTLVAPQGGWFAEAAQLEAEALRSERAAEGYVSRQWYREAADERRRADALRARASACRTLATLAHDPR